MTAGYTSGSFCSLGDSLSWTDLSTNLVMLPEVHLNQGLAQFIAFGAAPRSLLPNFLHEATHHWCFLSPVGSTLAALQLQARGHAIELLRFPEQERRNELEVQLCEALIRAETAEACLRPLAEGLALFTEFDAMSNPDSSILSLPLLMAMKFFGNIKFSKTKFGPTLMLANMLRRMRLDEHSVKRKVGLFGKPLSYSGGGYLPGYLTVRDLWLRAAARDARLLYETDLVLMYLRSFFFEDMGLVAKLLDPKTEDLKSMEAILSHISQRFLTFFDVESSDIESYEQNVLKYQDDPQQRLDRINFNLRVDEELCGLGDRLLRELTNEFKSNKPGTVDDLLKLDPADILNQLLKLHAADILNQRDVMYVGSLPVKVIVDRDGYFRALHEEALVLEAKAVDGAVAGTGDGSLDLFFSILHGQFKVMTITRDKELVATRFLAPDSITKNAASRFDRFIGQRTVLQSLRYESNRALKRALKNSWMKILVRHVRQQLPSLVEKIYLPIAFDSVPDNKLETNYAIMREDGLLPVLNWDRDLAEGLALLGLCHSAMSPDRMSISSWFKKNSLDLDVTMAKLQQCTQEYGLPQVLNIDNGHQLLSTI